MNKKLKEPIKKCYFLHPGIEIYCDEKAKTGKCNCHQIKSFKHIKDMSEKIDWNICAYCKKTNEQVELEFSCMDGSICTECSDQWENDHPKAMSKKDIEMFQAIMKRLY